MKENQKEKRKGKAEERAEILVATEEFLRGLPKVDGGYDVSARSLFTNRPPSTTVYPDPLTTPLNERKLHILARSSSPSVESEKGQVLTEVPTMVQNLIHGKEQFNPSTTFACRLEVSYLFENLSDELLLKALSKYRVMSHEEISMPRYRARQKLQEFPKAIKLIILAGEHVRRCTAGEFQNFDEGYQDFLLYESMVLIEGGHALLNKGMLDPKPDADKLDDVADWGMQRGRYLFETDDDGNESLKVLSGLPTEDIDYKRVIRIPVDATTEFWYFVKAESRHQYSDMYLSDHKTAAAKIAKASSNRLLPHLNISDIMERGLYHHDDGKDTRIWRTAAGATSVPLAKSSKFNPGIIQGFRHELASTALLEEHEGLLPHLVAAHHGHARPYFKKNAPDPDNRERCEVTMQEREQEFQILQERWGFWGLAFLEACFKSWDAMSEDEVKND